MAIPRATHVVQPTTMGGSAATSSVGARLIAPPCEAAPPGEDEAPRPGDDEGPFESFTPPALAEPLGGVFVGARLIAPIEVEVVAGGAALRPWGGGVGPRAAGTASLSRSMNMAAMMRR